MWTSCLLGDRPAQSGDCRLATPQTAWRSDAVGADPTGAGLETRDARGTPAMSASRSTSTSPLFACLTPRHAHGLSTRVLVGLFVLSLRNCFDLSVARCFVHRQDRYRCLVRVATCWLCGTRPMARDHSRGEARVPRFTFCRRESDFSSDGGDW